MKNPYALFRRGLTLCRLVAIALLGSMVVGQAQTSSTGTISGRVLNEGTGQYLRDAVVTVEGTSISTTTEAGGEFTLLNVPAGATKLVVTYLGLDPGTTTVEVPAGGTARTEVNLTSAAYRAEKEVVKLGAFVVASEREGNAKAVNEQKQSLDMKTVIASDAFGDVSEGNVGEFLKNMPGIGVDYVEADVRTISIGGLDPKYTTVLMDGAPVSSAASSNIGTGRTFEFEQLSITSIDTIEVSKTPTPDVAGSAMAGVVNLRSKGAFDRKGQQFNYRLSMTANSMDMTLRKTPGWDNQDRYKIMPNLFLEYTNTFFGNRLGVIASYNYSYTFGEQKAQTFTWAWDSDPTNNRTEIPRVTAISFRDSPKPSMRKNYNLRLDYKLDPNTWFWLRADYNTYQAKFYSRDYTINFPNNQTYNAPGGPVDPTVEYSVSSQTTAAGTASINQGGGATDKHGFTTTPAVGFNMKRGPFALDTQLQYSLSTNWYSDLPEGFFWATGTSNVTGLKLRFNRNGPADPALFITQLAGPDWRNLASYPNGFTAAHYDRAGKDYNWAGKADARYNFTFKVPVLLKSGLNVTERIRDVRYLANNNAYTHVGPDHVANTADDAPALYAEPSYRMTFDMGGNIDGVANMDRWKLAQELKDHPDYWTAPTASSLLQTQLQNTFKIREQVSAAYLQPIVKLTPQFDVAPGVRFERTRGWGRGASNLGDPLTRLALTGSRTGTVDTSSESYIRTRYGLREGYVDPYDTWLKYLHTNLKLTRDLVLRVSYNESITRPDLNRMVAGITINNDAAIPPTATLNNPDLQPERARNMYYSLEYYTREAGFASISFARRDIKDLIRSSSEDIPVGGEFLGDPYWGGWRISSFDNVAKAHNSSIEAAYRSPQLKFLPSYLSGLSFYANYTKLFYDNYENFRRATEMANGGLNYRYRKFAATWKTNWVPEYRNSSYSAAGIATWNSARIMHDMDASYQFTRELQVFLNCRNIFNSSTGMTFNTRSDIIQRWVRTGAIWQIGVKGTF